MHYLSKSCTALDKGRRHTWHTEISSHKNIQLFWNITITALLMIFHYLSSIIKLQQKILFINVINNEKSGDCFSVFQKKKKTYRRSINRNLPDKEFWNLLKGGVYNKIELTVHSLVAYVPLPYWPMAMSKLIQPPCTRGTNPGP